MLILSQDGRILLDMKSGEALRAQDNGEILSERSYVMGQYSSKEEAKAVIRELYRSACNGDFIEEMPPASGGD